MPPLSTTDREALRLRLKVYRLMYRFGAWVGHCRIPAETDDEAVHDAKEVFDGSDTLRSWPYEVALFCGERKVATLKEADKGMYLTQTV